MKRERLLDRHTRGSNLAAVFNHPEVEAFFSAFEETAINDIISALNDEERAREVLRLSIGRELKVYLQRIVDDGEAAGKRLNEAAIEVP